MVALFLMLLLGYPQEFSKSTKNNFTITARTQMSLGWIHISFHYNTFTAALSQIYKTTAHAAAPATINPPIQAFPTPPALAADFPLVEFELDSVPELVTFGFPVTVAALVVTAVAFLQTSVPAALALALKVTSAQLYNPPSGSPFVTT